MDKVLVDTSVWINFFKGFETPSSLYLKNNLNDIVIFTCPVIVQEVLQGIISDKDFRYLNSYFDTLTRLIENSYELAYEAAKLYRELRRSGITIRKPNDCLIAVYAIRNNIALLHDDRDFQLIARHTKLKIV